ncbi:unnamed protein product [Somion occarium]|uniref:WKF domain-containing protein n=1 Tax=Somion occarium TaxID=3059160 RepID=A0ABP1D199_9APHY
MSTHSDDSRPSRKLKSKTKENDDGDHIIKKCSKKPKDTISVSDGNVEVEGKKKRKRKPDENAAVTESTDNRKKKKHSKYSGDAAPEQEAQDVDMKDGTMTKEKKGKRKGKEEARADAEEDFDDVAGGVVSDTERSTSRKEKKHRKSEKLEAQEDNQDTSVVDDTAQKPRKKKKDKKVVREDEDPKSEKSKEKKRKHNESSDDPEDDESLTDQARKALSYVYIYSTNRSAWKFNKARQNWLIRNVWSSELVPDKYVPLVNKYLQSVQGGVRENLIKSCREAIAGVPADTPSKAVDESENPVEPASVHANNENPAQADTVRRTRASDLLAVLLSDDS